MDINFEKRKRLERDVNVTYFNRPVKIAFLVPFDENQENHKILDAVFAYSYSCWAGTRFIILKLNSNGELRNSEEVEWLSIYDADVVYSYTSLTAETVNSIEKFNSPANLIKHDFGRDDYRSYIPKIDYYFSPVGSISTIHSPSIFSDNPFRRDVGVLKIITQNDPADGDRFVADNFGNQVIRHNVLHEIPGLLQTICLTSESTPENHHVGTERVHSLAELLSILAKRVAYPVSRLAALHSEEMSVINSHRIGSAFSLVIGKAVEDRILFWSLRHHYDLRHSCLGCMIISPDDINDELLKELGGYLNNNNFTGEGGSNSVSLVSRSLSKSKLNSEFKDAIQKHTYNTVRVCNGLIKVK